MAGATRRRGQGNRNHRDRSPTADLEDQIGRISIQSALATIQAAGSSPGCGHRWASLHHLLWKVLQAPNHGGVPLSPQRLRHLLRAVLRDQPQLRHLEDFVPHDQRLRVVARWEGKNYRLFPGQTERPIADVARARLLSDAIDDSVISRHGFGIRHLTRVALYVIHSMASAMSEGWHGGDRPGIGDAPILTRNEIARMTTFSEDFDLAPTDNTERIGKALAWATRKPAEISYAVGQMQESFGSALALWLPHDWISPTRSKQGAAAPGDAVRRWWLPLSLLPESWVSGVAELSQSVRSKETIASWTRAVSIQVRRSLWHLGEVGHFMETDGTPTVSPMNAIAFVCRFGPARAVLVQVHADVDLRARKQPAEFMAVKIANMSESERDSYGYLPVPLADGTLRLDKRSEVVPLIVFAGPGHTIPPRIKGAATLSLEDLRWIAKTADSDVDFYLFCRDLARSGVPSRSPDPANEPMLAFGWEGINYWESWRSNGKSFFSGGSNPLIYIAPHASEEEWLRGAEQARLEDSLLALRLPSSGDFDSAISSGGPFYLTRRSRGASDWRGHA